LIVSTPERPSEFAVERALRIAEELGSPFVPRSNKTIHAMRAASSEEDVLIVGSKEIRLLSVDQPPFFFHPSMAIVRLKRLFIGGRDTLLTVSGIQAGDTVVDCTAGLCSDALVFSYAVGSGGKVIAVEASKVIHAIVREGLQTYETGLQAADEALRAIQPALGNHLDILSGMGDRSADLVYFDPMFDKPIKTSSSLVPLRSKAVREPLSEEAVSEAMRVARKKVVLKDHRDSGQFGRLGFERVRVSSSAVAYGVINIE
jgi:hypothetical protein